MAIVTIHGWADIDRGIKSRGIKLGGTYLLVGVDDPCWYQHIPLWESWYYYCDLVLYNLNKTVGQVADQTDGCLVLIPIEQLNVRLLKVDSKWVDFVVMGKAVGADGWQEPFNWSTLPSEDGARVVSHDFMPIFPDARLGPAAEPKLVQPGQPSFFEARLAESRAKWKEEEACAPPRSRRAFEFL